MCCPARCPDQSGTSRTRVCAVGLSVRTSRTSAIRHRVGRCMPAGTATGDSVTPVTLLAPGVAVVVVAQRLPEAWLVRQPEVDALDPLGGLPEVQVRHQEA